MSKPMYKIRMPPVILNAGILILNNSKIYLPSKTNTVTMINAIIFALLLMSLLVLSSAPWVRDKKTVMFDMGLVIAKKPVNTVIEKVSKLSIGC
jgi:hypothetical protein